MTCDGRYRGKSRRDAKERVAHVELGDEAATGGRRAQKSQLVVAMVTQMRVGTVPDTGTTGGRPHHADRTASGPVVHPRPGPVTPIEPGYASAAADLVLAATAQSRPTPAAYDRPHRMERISRHAGATFPTRH